MISDEPDQKKIEENVNKTKRTRKAEPLFFKL